MKRLINIILLLFLSIYISGQVVTTNVYFSTAIDTSTLYPEYKIAFDAMLVKPRWDTAWQQNLMFKRIVDTCNADLFYMFANNTRANAYINWMNPGTFNVVDSVAPVFTTYSGITGNGTTHVVTTDFNAYRDSASAYFSKNDAGIGVYMRTNASGNYAPYGARTAEGLIRMIPFSSNVMNTSTNSSQINTTPSASSLGFAATTRTSRTVVTNYMNGVDLTGNDACTSNELIDADIFILAYNYFSSTKSTYHFPGEISAFILGEGFSVAQLVEINDAIEDYMDYLGKGVE